MILNPSKREQVFSLPVVLISTISKGGVRNAAPWSNITPILRPLDEIVLASWLKRDTLDNIRDVGEFVVNVPTADMAEAVKVCSRNYPPEVDEFKEAGLFPHPSSNVKPPGIEGSIAWMECTLVEEISRERFSLIVGKVVCLEADDRFFDDEGDMDFERARPLSAMLGHRGAKYTRPVSCGSEQKYSEMFLGKGEGPGNEGTGGDG
ncbi:MAG TPA: flavin reductase family protein [Methanothrix sp.]|nr:flavin reductase family protein [Methanothrix sp.]